jgi:hypothetical protein
MDVTSLKTDHFSSFYGDLKLGYAFLRFGSWL